MVGCQAAYESWGDAYTALATASLYFNQIETPHLYRAQHAAFSTLPGEGSKSCFSFPQQATSLVCRHELEHFLQKEECFSVLNSNLFHFHLFFFLILESKNLLLNCRVSLPCSGRWLGATGASPPQCRSRIGPWSWGCLWRLEAERLHKAGHWLCRWNGL